MARSLQELPEVEASRQRAARRRFRYRRRHTPHFYLVIAALSSATVLCLLDGFVSVDRGAALSGVAFVATGVTTVLVLASYFWGFFMVMNGNIPMARIGVFLPHAVVGTLSPLVYMLNLSLLFDLTGSSAFPGSSVALAVLSLALLGVQFLMGRRVVRVERPRLLKLHT